MPQNARKEGIQEGGIWDHRGRLRDPTKLQLFLCAPLGESRFRVTDCSISGPDEQYENFWICGRSRMNGRPKPKSEFVIKKVFLLVCEPCTRPKNNSLSRSKCSCRIEPNCAQICFRACSRIWVDFSTRGASCFFMTPGQNWASMSSVSVGASCLLKTT